MTKAKALALHERLAGRSTVHQRRGLRSHHPGCSAYGKSGCGLGYPEGLTHRSPLELEPEGFYDLGEIVQREYRLKVN
jgi:hypothetical protein